MKIKWASLMLYFSNKAFSTAKSSPDLVRDNFLARYQPGKGSEVLVLICEF